MKSLLALFAGLIVLLGALVTVQLGVFTPRPVLTIAAAPANEVLEPLIADWAAETRTDVQITYLGPLDMAATLEQGTGSAFDAVWPATSLRLAQSDRQGIVRHATPIVQGPIVVGLRKSIANDLGWVGRDDVALAEILEAAQDGRFRLSMASAPRSTLGAATYFGLLAAQIDPAETLTLESLQDDTLRTQLRSLLDSVDRSAADAGWLSDTLVSHYDVPEAMFNFEAEIIRANLRLTEAGKEPLYAIYPADLPVVADSPFGFVPRDNPETEALFFDLLELLNKPDARALLFATGQRAGRIALDPNEADPAVWNTDWGIDAGRSLPNLLTPPADVIDEALRLYQTTLRKPSFTVWVLDLSNSMAGDPVKQVKTAMAQLLDPDQAATHLLQPTADDVTIIVPYTHTVLEPIIIDGTNATASKRALRFVQGMKAEGGSDLYFALYEAFEAMRPYAENGTLFDHLPSIIALTGSGSDSESRVPLLAHRDDTGFARFIPIHTIAFSHADPEQLQELSTISAGQHIPAGQDLDRAVRDATGYN
jgi:Ca-activated chloride channel family protein